jgi:hypothetical protein
MVIETALQQAMLFEHRVAASLQSFIKAEELRVLHVPAPL